MDETDPARPSAAAPIAPSTRNLLPTDTRRRSVSLSSAIDPNRNEDDPLHGELKSWALDWDGVLAGLGREPSSSSALAKSTPAPLAAGREAAMARLTQSERIPRTLVTSPVATGRPKSITSPSSPALPAAAQALSDATPGSPLLRSPKTTPNGVTAGDTKVNGVKSTGETAPTAEVGLGLGLETIREGHSRDNSVSVQVTAPPTTEPVSTKGNVNELATTPDAGTRTGIPLLVTQSPSPAAAAPSTAGSSTFKVPSTPTRQKSRQSVVAYPRAGLTGVSRSTSNMSFGASNVSLGAHADSDEEVERAPTPGGTTMEERAEELAQRVWVDDETFLKREKVAEWLGGQ